MIATQHPFAYKYIIANIIDDNQHTIESEHTFIGEDSVNSLLDKLSEDWESIRKKYNYPINVSDEDRKRHIQIRKCDICNSSFSSKNPKVLHHVHLLRNNNYASILCNTCNLRLPTPAQLPVIIHNLSYDLTLILKYFNDTKYKVDITKKNGNNYDYARIGNLKFIDSVNMLKGRLNHLSNEHIKNNGNLNIVNESLRGYSDEAKELLTRSGKQFFPYKFLKGEEQLKVENLPAKHYFYSSLTDQHITSDDYNQAQLAWEKNGCRTTYDYVNLYLNLDVAFLADIYLQWRSILLELFSLDCLYFLTLSYAFEVMLYKTNLNLDIVSDPQLCQLINSNIRGEFCSVCQRHVKAVNKDAVKNFDSKLLKSNYLMYVTSTVCTQQSCPNTNFQWVTLKN